MKTFLALAALALLRGGAVTFEWPKHCIRWMLEELLQFVLRWRLYVADVDGCACGMVDKNGAPFLKQLRFLASEPRVACALSKLRCKHDRPFQHAAIEGVIPSRQVSIQCHFAGPF